MMMSSYCCRVSHDPQMILKEIFEPMQSEYELQSVDTPNASHDASITLPNDEDKRYDRLYTMP